MRGGIYLIINLVNRKQYVGSSKSLNRRKHHHWNRLRNGRHPNPHLQSAYNLYGEQSFAFVVVEYCDEADLVEREGWWITLLDSMNLEKGYNLLCADRHRLSESTRAKISAAARKTQTAETRAKISAANKGKVLSPEHVEKMARSLTGRPGVWVGKSLSSEHKAKISAATQGRVPWNKGVRGIPWSEARRDVQGRTER